MSKITYSVVIPVYNSNHSLVELVARLRAVFAAIPESTFEVIFVDDCSLHHETWPQLSALASQNSFVRSFRLARNFGQAAAVLCGITKARGEWIITMDDDLQHRPEDIPLLISQKEHDVVIGCFTKKQCGYFKKLSSRIKGFLDTQLLGLPKGMVSTSFKLIKRRVAHDMLKISTPRPFIIALILEVTLDLVNVVVLHEPRRYGKSNYSFRKSLSSISNMLFNNSSFMLRMMSLFGIFLSGVSCFFGIMLIVRKIVYQLVFQGWTSLMVVTLMSTGFIIFCMGILGEYVCRLIEISENRPRYSIRESHDRYDHSN